MIRSHLEAAQRSERPSFFRPSAACTAAPKGPAPALSSGHHDENDPFERFFPVSYKTNTATFKDGIAVTGGRTYLARKGGEKVTVHSSKRGSSFLLAPINSKPACASGIPFQILVDKEIRCQLEPQEHMNGTAWIIQIKALPAKRIRGQAFLIPDDW